MNFKKSISLVLTLCMVFSLFATFVFPVAAEEGSAIIEFRDTTNRVSFDTESQVWSANGITVTGNKASSSTNVADYSNPARFYKSSTVTVEYPGMTKIVIDAPTTSSNKYLTPWVDSLNDANATATVDGSYVTITFAEAVDTFTITLTAGQARAYEMVVYYAIEEETPAVTSNVVTDWNIAQYGDSEFGASAAIIFTDAEAYLATTGYTWWSHASFKPTDEAGVYEVVDRRGATGEAPTYEIAEGGFVWMAHDTAAEGTPGKYAHTIIQTLNAGDKVVFTGLDIANKTTAADATAEKVIPPEEIFDAPEFAGENVALNKTYTYPTENLYYHWSDEWPCTDNVATALTDGVRVAGYYGKGETSGWGGAEPRFVDIVIDLEAVYDISGFAYVLTGGADGIQHPETVEISVSTDGVTYVPVSVETVSGNKYSSESWSPCYDLDYYATPAAATAGRYVKFVFHKVEGTNFIFINELEVWGKEVVEETNEVVVNVNENAMLTDGVTGFTGNWGEVGNTDVLLIANGKCTTMAMNVVVNYALGETKTIDALVLDFYHCAGVMIGYPEGKVLVEYSVDGVEYTVIGEYDLAAAELAVGSYGTVSTVCEFDAVEAAYVRATFVVGSSTGVLGDTPADNKVFWEFASLAEVAVNVVPEMNDVVVNVNENAMLTDGVTGFTGNWGEVGNTDVLLIANGECKTMAMNVVVNYALGETKTIDALVLDFYHCAGVMIGYPEGQILVEYSVDGVEYTEIGLFDLAAAELAVGSYGTVSTVCEFDAVDAAYVRATFVVGSSTGVLGDTPSDNKIFWEFASLAEVAVNEVSDVVELPEEATGLDVYGYTHTFLNYVMYVDADMTLGELTAKYYGSSKDLNYFKVIVVNADGTVAATYLELDRNTNPASVKTDIAVTAGQIVLALSANENNVGRHEIADTVNVGDIVTLYNVDFTAEPGELTGAGFTVEAATSGDLNEVEGGELPAFNPRLGQNLVVPANTAITYTVAFENGAFFSLYDETVTVLVNGEAIEGDATLAKGDKVTVINATAEEYAVYPMVSPIIMGTMSNPIVLEEIGDLTADVNMDILMDGGAVHYIYTAPANGKVIVTMLDESWTYTVNNLTAGVYGDSQWSDSDPVLKSYTVEVSAGDEIQIVVGTYDAENPWAAPEGKVNFNVRFLEKQDIVDLKVSHNNLYNWGTYESMIISEAGKTVTDVISQTPYWWIMYVVEKVDGVYVATEFYKNCDEINTTVCPEDGFLYYVYSSNSAWAVADEGMLLGYIFNLNDIDLSAPFAIDTSANDPKIMTAINPDALKVGDVNMNGKIDANDYATIRKLVVGSVKAEDLSEMALALADVNGNGKIDANDYILVKRHFLGTYTIPAWEEVE